MSKFKPLRGIWCVMFHRKHWRRLRQGGDWVDECCDKCRERWSIPRMAARTAPLPDPLESEKEKQ